MDAYTEAHLMVAAVRVLQHREGSPPRLESVCELLTVSVELGSTICRRLVKAGIVETIEDPFGVKLLVADHLAIEQLEKQAPKEDSLAKELAAFQEKKKISDDKIAAIQAEMAKKKKAMFADLEAKFKK